MSWITVISTAAVALSIVGSFVQIIHLFRKQTAAGLSQTAMTIGPAVSFLWLFYGISQSDFPLALTYGTTTAIGLITIWKAHRLMGQRPTKSFAILGGLVAALIANATFGLPLVVAVLTASITCIRPGLQTWTSLSSNEYKGINFKAFMMFSGSCVLWMIYGLQVADPITAGTSFWCAACYVVVAARARVLQAREERVALPAPSLI